MGARILAATIAIVASVALPSAALAQYGPPEEEGFPGGAEVVVDQVPSEPVIVEEPAVGPPEAPTEEATARILLVEVGREGALPPGADVPLEGDGCPPGGPVEVLLADDVVGTAVAGDDGSFSVTLELPAEITPGRYPVTVQCGETSTDTSLDVVLASVVQPGGGGSLGLMLVIVIVITAWLVVARGVDQGQER